MPDATRAAGREARAVPVWALPAARAVVAIVLGLVITFSADHSAPLGLAAFGAFAVATGLIIGGFAVASGSRSGVASGVAPPTRGASIAQAAVTLLAGIAALAVPTGGVGYLVLVVSGWAIIAGALELVSGLRGRRRGASRQIATNDSILVGALTVLLGIAVLVVPPDLAIPFEGDKGVSGVLTSAVIVVGSIGFWGIISGVLLAISAASPRASGTEGSE